MTLNGETIVAGGATPGPATAVVENAPTSSSWALLPNDDAGRVGPGLVSTPGGLLIYGGAGGPQGTASSNSAYLYDVTGQNSDSAPDMISPRMQLAYAADGSGQAYAIGGVDDTGTTLATVERFNATSLSWATVAPLPAARCGAAAAFDGSGAIYVVGGSAAAGDTTGTNTLYKYTVSTNQWTTLAPLPYAVRDAAAVFAPDGKLDVIGGISGGVANASVETYDPATDTWASNTALPAAISSAAAVVDGAGRIEVIGGYDASQQPLADVELSQVVDNPVASPAFSTTPAAASLTVASGSTFTYAAAASGNPLANFALTAGPAGMTIDPVSGYLSWTSPASFVGPAAVTITATNPLGSVAQSFNLSVVDKTPPTAPGTPVLTGETATSVTLSWAPSTDNVGVAGYAVYWIYTTGHSGRGGGITTHTILEATTDGATSVTVNGLTQNHSYALYVQAHDAAGNKSPYSAPIDVIPGAAPYAFQAFQAGFAVYQASDLANHPLSLQLSSTSFSPPVYSALNAPSGMTVDPNTGAVAWLPGANDLGTTSVTFQATNQFGTTSLVVAVTVTPDYPVPDIVFTNTLSPTFDIVGQPVSATLVDRSNTPSTFSVVSGPSGLSVDPVSGVLDWTPTPDQAGNLPETFQLTNAFGSRTLSTGIVIYVASPPQNVTASGLDTSSPMLSWQPPAYNANLVASYNINISGGGLGGQVGYTFSTGAANLSTSLAGIVAAGQTYQVNIQALDAAGRQGLWNTSLSFTYNPANPTDGPLSGAPVTLTATEGSATTGAVALFTDGNFSGPASNFTAQIDWGDGSPPTTATVNGANGSYTISGSHTYSDGGQTLPVTVVVNDADGSTITVNSLASITDAPLTGAGATVAETEGSTFAGSVASFTDANPLAQSGNFTATIDWGDGQTSAGTVAASASAFSVIGSHAYAHAGTFVIKTTVTDEGQPTMFIGGAVVAVSSDVQHVQYVSAVYEDVLGRAPDAAGLAYWTGLLGQGVAMSSVAAAIAHSDEYYADFVVKPDYLKLLGRAADDAGVRYWTAQLDHGATDQQLQADLVSSGEFFRTAGGTNLKWLDAVYTLLLGRAADAGGESYWVDQLQHGEALSQVAQAIASGQENNTQLINADYLHYLGRSADPAGLSYWLNEFATGRTNEDIIAGFTGSAEYYSKHTS